MNRYQDIPQTKINKKTVYRTSHYPEVPLSVNDVYVYASDGDRFDILANQYYGDSSLWWVISIANDQIPQNSIVIPLGEQIRIPANYLDVIEAFNQINS